MKDIRKKKKKSQWIIFTYPPKKSFIKFKELEFDSKNKMNEYFK